MYKILLYFICFCSQLNAQIDSKVISTFDNTPVPYANIWKSNLLHITTDSIGSFMIGNKETGQSIKITAVGFTDTIVKIGGGDIYLRPTITQLNEVNITQRNYEKTTKIGKAKRGDAIYVARLDSKIARTAKFFPNLNIVGSYLDKVKFFAMSSTKNRIMSILLYSVDEDGSPGEVLNSENILCRFKKGHKSVEINLANLNIEFPKEGIFVVLQHMLLEQNKQYGTYDPKWFFYEPGVAVNNTDGFEDTYYLTESGWVKNEGASISMELTLSD